MSDHFELILNQISLNYKCGFSLPLTASRDIYSAEVAINRRKKIQNKCGGRYWGRYYSSNKSIKENIISFLLIFCVPFSDLRPFVEYFLALCKIRKQLSTAIQWLVASTKLLFTNTRKNVTSSDLLPDQIMGSLT